LELNYARIPGIQEIARKQRQYLLRQYSINGSRIRYVIGISEDFNAFRIRIDRTEALIYKKKTSRIQNIYSCSAQFACSRFGKVILLA
jgi:hypothetical protein